MNLLVKFRKDLPLSVFADKHSIGTSPERGLHMYFSASFHFEFNAKPSGDRHSHVFTDLACNAAFHIQRLNINIYRQFILQNQDDACQTSCMGYMCLSLSLPLRALVNEYVDGSISSMKNKTFAK